MSQNFALTSEMINEFSNFNTKRHLSTKFPREAYFYFPSEEEIIDYDNKHLNKLTRKIFEGGVEYICYEKAKLEELENEIAIYNQKKGNENKKVILPHDWREYNSLRFLQATGFNISKTIEIISNNLVWRKENLPPVVINKTMEILNIGYLYIHGRDNRFRPIIHINASVISKNTKKYNFNDWNQATIFFMEYTIKNLLLPGQIENWDIICDLKDVSVMSLPSDFKKILGILQNNYRCRLFKMFIINVGSFFNMMWTVIKKIIDNNTEKKIKILKKENLFEMFHTIHPSQIERKYCGEATDITSYFFPPIFPSDKYLSLEDDEKKLFVSEEEYRKKIMLNPSLIVSPYVNIINPSSMGSNDNILFAEEEAEKNKKMKEKFFNDSKIEMLNKDNNNDDSVLNDLGSDLINFKNKFSSSDNKNLSNDNDYLLATLKKKDLNAKAQFSKFIKIIKNLS